VYARRANPEPDPTLSIEPAPGPSEDRAESPEQLTASVGIAFASQPFAAPSSAPLARARARRSRARQANKVTEAKPASEAQPLAAADPPQVESSAERQEAQPIDPALGSKQTARGEPEQSGVHDVPASIVEEATWAAGLQRAEDVSPPSLEHPDFADDFGLDAEYETKLRPWLDSLCERHFHVELYGADNIPAHGRALLVANHSRASVWDGIVLRAALRLHHPTGRMPRWLVDDQQFHAPFLGTIVNRLGAVRACQENAERLLLREELVAVFPEGSKATSRPYEERYRLQRFGRGGYVKLALRTGTPVLPVAIVATEHEGAVWRNRLANASRVLAAPFAALRPGLPRIGTLGVPPISAHVRIYVGAAIAEISRQDASVTQDDGLVHELNECVRSAIQSLVNASLQA
jgi:hypothetical protein